MIKIVQILKISFNFFQMIL